MDRIEQKTQHTWAWLFGGLAVVFLRVLPALRFPIGRDQATYCVIGQGLLRGQLLYRDLWDNKPPGIFHIYALIVKTFGPVMWSVGVVDILWLLTISVCIFYFAKRYLGAPAAAIAMVANALAHCFWGYIHAGQPETLLMLFIFGAWFLLSRSDPSRPLVPRVASSPGRVPSWAAGMAPFFAAGLLCGAAFWLKYNAAPFFPVLTLLPYLDWSRFDEQPRRVRITIAWRVWLKQTTVITVAFLLISVAILVYFWITGSLAALKEVQFEVLPRYGSMFIQRMPGYFYYAIILTRLHLGAWTEAAVAATLLVASWRRQFHVVAPVLVMAGVGFISTASQIRFSSYMFETTYPFCAMLWGYLVVQLYEGFMYVRASFARRGWRLAGALWWLVAAQVAYFPLPEYIYDIKEEYGCLDEWARDPEQSYARYAFAIPLEKLHDQMEIISYLKKNSAPGDGVFVWGTAPLINFLSQRPNPSRFVSNFALISSWAPKRWRQELIGELSRRPPRYIVVARHDVIPGVTFNYSDSEGCLGKYPELAGFIGNRYEPLKNLFDFEVYRLKGP